MAPRAAPTTLYASSEHIMGVKLEQPLLSLVIEQFEFCGAVVKVSMNLMLFATAAPLWPKFPKKSSIIQYANLGICILVEMVFCFQNCSDLL